jgi:cytochrome c
MNLSQWPRDSSEEQQALEARIVRAVKKREMPPLQYLAIHWNAHLSPEEIYAIVQWGGPTQSGDRAQASATPTVGDPGRGKLVFEKRCAGCHALNTNRDGPHLAGVYGRTAGSVNGFDYSEALKKSRIVWNEETLNRWLTDPQTMVPGADMDFYVVNPNERADVIAYLKQQSGK